MSINCAKCGKILTPLQAGEPCPDCGNLDRSLSAEEQAVLEDKARVAAYLARKHFQLEPGITEIFTVLDQPRYEALPTMPIKLLEVNQNTIASGIQPLGFDPAPTSGIPYPSVIIEVTREEWQKIKSNQMPLPYGWTLGRRIPRRGSVKRRK